MGKKNKLINFINKSDGIITVKNAEAIGIQRQYLATLAKENKLERVAQGVYLRPDSFDDEMYRIQLKNQRIIYSHETALYLHDLTDRDPIYWSATVPKGYNATHLRQQGISIYTTQKNFYKMGVVEASTIYGRPVKAYNKEKTICDLFRNKNNTDKAVLIESVKRYLSLKEKNIPLLLRYAKHLSVEKKVRSYIEILL